MRVIGTVRWPVVLFVSMLNIAGRPQSTPVNQTPAADARTARSIMEFGAKCDGSTDDTAAINRAVAQANSAIGPYDTVTVPQARCRITGPIKVTVNGNAPNLWAPSLRGTGSGSTLLVDYGSWSGGSDYNAIEYVTDKAGGSVRTNLTEVAYLTLIAENYGSFPTVAFSSHTNATGASTNSTAYTPIVGGNIHDLYLFNFQTGLDLQELYLTDVHDINSQSVGTIVHIHGEVVNSHFHHIYYPNSINSSSTAFLVESKSYGASKVQPEGLTIDSNILYGAKTDLDVESGYSINVISNIFDGATGDAVIINAPYHIDFEHNFVSSTANNSSSIRMVPLKEVITDTGIVSNNYLTGTSNANGQYGLNVEAGGNARFNLHFDNNFLSLLQYPVYIKKNPYASWILNNYFSGSGDTGSITANIELADPGNTSNVYIDKNTSPTSTNMLSASGATGYVIGQNCNLSGCTGTQTLAGNLGCTTAAAVGAVCTTSMQTWTIPFLDANYSLVCGLNHATGVPLVSTTTQTAAGFTITIAAATAAAATANYSCIATAR